ncbi:hypothetical protein PFISCL1PPCAC_13022, partial [Pristionchus fissidentatus]
LFPLSSPTGRSTMLSNAFRSVCRLRNATIFDNSYASLVGLGKLQQLQHAAAPSATSVVEQLLLTPSAVSAGESYSPPSSYSILLGSPLSSLGSPNDSTDGWSLEDEKSFDCKYGIYELDSLICDEFDDVRDEVEGAIQSCSGFDDDKDCVELEKTEEENDEASFHAFIDELILTVKEEIQRETALEKCPDLPRSGADCVALVIALSPTESIPGMAAREAVLKDDRCAASRKRLLSDSEPAPAIRKRKRIFSLEEMALRKRNQNRRAAQRYREKLVKLKSEQAEECTELEEKNDALREDIRELEEEIERFKKLLLTKAEETRTKAETQ